MSLDGDWSACRVSSGMLVNKEPGWKVVGETGLGEGGAGAVSRDSSSSIWSSNSRTFWERVSIRDLGGGP